MRTALVIFMLSLLPVVQIPVFAADSAQPAKIENLHKFSESLAGISVKGKWGFIDESGKVVIEALFHEVRQYHKGYAAVKLVNKWGVIDRNGEYVVNPSYDDMGTFSEDLVAVKVDGKWGYINVKDQMVIPLQFSEALPFKSGLAAVRIGSSWGFIDNDGKFAINPRFNGASSFSNNLAPVKDGSLWGFINKSGEFKIKPQFQNALGFTEGLAAVQEDTMWGFIRPNGHYAIKPQYDNATSFAEGLAPVQKDGKWGYITPKDKQAIPFQYTEADQFSNDIARVVSGGQVTFITPKGKDAGVGVTATVVAAAAAGAVQQPATAVQAKAPVAPLPVKAAAPQPLKDSGAFTVTPVASMSGSSNGAVSGSISPNTPQAVNANGTITFTIKPTAGTSVTTPLGGTCGGTFTGNPADSVNGITYTTNPVTYDCTVEVPSFPPLTSQAWQNTVIPKHRAIISFLDTSGNINTFRGQGGDLQLSDTGIDFSSTYGTNVLTTNSSNLGVKGSSSSRVFSMAQTPGIVPQTVNLPAGQEFMGTTTFTQVPTGMLCSSYLTMTDSNGNGTSLWIELTGQSETTGNTQRFGRVELTGVPAPVYQYKFNADGSHVLAPATDLNVAHDMVSWDWNGDGYSDYMISYLHNPSGNNNWEKNMRVALVFIDGQSLYNASKSGSQDPGKRIFIWTNIDNQYTTGGDMVGGLTDVKPSNSVRLAIGDMDGDKKPEVALYYTKVQGPTGLAHNNAMKILRLVDAGTTNVYSDTSKAPDFNWVISTDSDACKNDKNCSSMYQQVGESYLQYDSAVVAMGDLDGDGKDELAVLHGNTAALYQPSRTYLDVYKMNSDKKSFTQPIAGVKVGTTSKMPSGKSSTPALEASIADLDGDGIGELVWTGLDQDNPDQLWIEVHKWPIVAATPGNPTATPPVAPTPQTVTLSGTGTQSAYALKKQTGLSNWTLDTTYVRYSMTTGRFVYPDASKTLRKQIGLVSTMPGSKIRWGIFKWDWDSSQKTGALTVMGNGTLANTPKIGNLVPSIVATDLDRDSMVLGQPTLITVTDSYSPFFIVQAPPKHFDLLSEVQVPQKDQRGNVIKDKNGNPVMGPRMMDSFSEFAGYSSVVTQGSEQAHMTSTTKSTAGEWGVSAGVEFGNENPHYIPPPTFAAGLSYTGTYNSDTTTTTGTTMSAETEATAGTDDQLYYWVNDLDIWLYPVLYPASQALITNPDGTTSRNFVRYVVPRVSGTAFSATNGKDVEWYEPWHNNLNLFSYPRQLADIKDYPQGAGSKPADSWWSSRNGTVFRSGSQWIGNDNETTFSFSITDTSQTETLKSTQHTIAPYVNFDPQHTGHIIKKDISFPIDLSGSGSWGTQTTASNDNSSLSGIVMNWPGGTEYSSRSGLTTADQKFQVNGSVYTSDTGTFSLAYAVTQLKSADSKIWGTASPYRSMADPALNLPSYYANNDGTWSANDAARESSRIRGLQLSGETIFTKENIRGQALPTGSTVTGSLRVYNYSFVPTGKVSVSFKFQPISLTTFEPPDITKATIDLGSQTITTIPGREQDASSNNWNDMTLTFPAPTQAGLGYLHVSLASTDPVTKDSSGNPKGGNLNINNDAGHILVGFYDAQTTGTSAVKSGAVKSRTPGSKSLKVVADSVSIRPIKADRTLGAAASVLEAGQKALVEAQIRFDDVKGAKSSGILHVNVYLRNSKGIVAHRTVPLLLNGKAHTVRLPYTAPKNGQSVPLQILVSSPYLPAAADSKPQGRTAKAVITVSKP